MFGLRDMKIDNYRDWILAFCIVVFVIIGDFIIKHL